MKRILIIAGEASADMHAANLVKSIVELSNKEVEFTGLGGNQLLETGHFSPEYHNNDFATFGLWELVGHIKKLFAAQKHFKTMSELGAYDLAVLLDYPDFNIPIAKYLTKQNIPVIYYITPQVWVWRSSRVYKLSKYCREILTVFPFEKSFFTKFGVDVKYVGHPLMDQYYKYIKNRDLILLQNEFEAKKERKIIAVLPGSRRGEIKYILPVMINACSLLSKKYPDQLRFIIPVAPTLKLADLTSLIPVQYHGLFEFVENKTYDLYSVADYAIVASGTSTVECGLFELPMTIVYKVSFLSAFLFKNIIRYKNSIGMVNLLLDKLVCKEFFQENTKPELIAEDVEQTLFNNEKYQIVKNELKKIKEVLYTGKSASLNAATEVLRYL